MEIAVEELLSLLSFLNNTRGQWGGGRESPLSPRVSRCLSESVQTVVGTLGTAVSFFFLSILHLRRSDIFSERFRDHTSGFSWPASFCEDAVSLVCAMPPIDHAVIPS